MTPSILIIALEYIEPWYSQTMDCVKATGLPYIMADRDGVGNMPKAFNRASMNINEFDLFWFISDITFKPDVPHILARNIGNYAAIHPVMNTSDHKHQHKNGNDVKQVPFIEWTAPMVRASTFSLINLDARIHSWYFDLDWSFRVRQAGYKVAVDHSCEVEHVYLRNKLAHPISRMRHELRNYHKASSEAVMIEKYGNDWATKLNWK